MSQHIASVRLYFAIFFALLIGTALTVAVAYVDLGVFNTVMALVIACIKASLVVLFFMHVKYSSGLTKLFVVSGFGWFLILVTLTLSDYFSRHWQHKAPGWVPGEYRIAAPMLNDAPAPGDGH